MAFRTRRSIARRDAQTCTSFATGDCDAFQCGDLLAGSVIADNPPSGPIYDADLLGIDVRSECPGPARTTKVTEPTPSQTRNCFLAASGCDETGVAPPEACPPSESACQNTRTSSQLKGSIFGGTRFTRPRTTLLSRPLNPRTGEISNEEYTIQQPNGAIVIVQTGECAAQSKERAMAQKAADEASSTCFSGSCPAGQGINGCAPGVSTTAGDFELRCYSRTESAVGCRISTGPDGLPPSARPQTRLRSTMQFRGRYPKQEFFNNNAVYRDPQDCADEATCSGSTTVPTSTTSTLYAVRFVDGTADEQGNTTRTPLVHDVLDDGTLVPTAVIERCLLTDTFEDLSGWNIVNSVATTNAWTSGTLLANDGSEIVQCGFVSLDSGATNNYDATDVNLMEDPAVVHLWQDVTFPGDCSRAELIVRFRVQGTASQERPGDYAQNFATFNLLDGTSTIPQSDVPLDIGTRMEGTLLYERNTAELNPCFEPISSTATDMFVLDRFVLRTPSFRAGLCGQTRRLVLSFHAGNGQLNQPQALAIDEIALIGNVVPPEFPPVARKPCPSTAGASICSMGALPCEIINSLM